MKAPRFLRAGMRSGSRGAPSRSRRVQPTPYPRVPFHAVRCTQLVSSAIVMSVMVFFIDQLAHDHYETPWTFFVLLCVSILTVLALIATMIAHCIGGLRPQFNLALNGGLVLLWSLGFGLLAWWSSGTLGHVCSVARWGGEDGVMVCRTYKALFAFAMLGFTSTLAALLLDLYVYKRFTQRGSYNAMLDYETKTEAVPIHPIERTGLGAFDPAINNLRHDDDDDSDDDDVFGCRGTKHQQDQQQPEAGRMLEDYAVPEQQFRYDTGYHGVHGDMGGY
ncbi:uncharacterized protein J3D65DRAFT_630602 [Phyllosticta citribraziliensis]|uniref:MARVEL domain-containing protein n=1 Tax=Phyllosticta citribraziliensis TaxID=989973 RepID=A0ABR1LJ89_9PEZI